MNTQKFSTTGEYAFRRMVRAAIRKSELTKSERDITVTLVNLWFHHRNGRKKYIHPGRAHLAKKSNVAIITVSRCLSKLRAAGIITDINNLRGEGQQPTQYTVDIPNLLALCGCDWMDDFMRASGAKCYTTNAVNDTPLAYQNDTQLTNVESVVKKKGDNQ